MADWREVVVSEEHLGRASFSKQLNGGRITVILECDNAELLSEADSERLWREQAEALRMFADVMNAQEAGHDESDG